jgi:hypothetical protein
MADLSDVLTVLAATAAAALYPNGFGQPSAVGVACKVYPGWPNAQQLDADLRAATPVCHVSIYVTPAERNTTRYSPNDWKPVATATPTLTLTQAGQTVTVAGTIPTAGNPHNLTVLANGAPYVYRVLTTDTLTTIAAALAALIAVDIAGTTSSGAVITLPTSVRLQAARVGVTGTALRELRRQERVVQIVVWASTEGSRSAIASTVDSSLAALAFVAMPDGSGARVRYQKSSISDAQQKDCLFRRDLMYTVEYATTQSETETQIGQEQMVLQAAVAGVLPYQTVAVRNG